MYSEKEKKTFEALIGHALEKIAAWEIPVYLGMIAGLSRVEDIIGNASIPEDEYESDNPRKFHLHVADDARNASLELWYPSAMAPPSFVRFWIDRLRLNQHKKIKTVFSYGMQRWQQVSAHLRGFFLFWEMRYWYESTVFPMMSTASVH